MSDSISSSREVVCSGIRPTGNLHLGNYFGALRNFVKMQNQHDCFFFIADYIPSLPILRPTISITMPVKYSSSIWLAASTLIRQPSIFKVTFPKLLSSIFSST